MFGLRKSPRQLHQSGQSLVEFTLVLPLLLIILFLFIEFGLGFARYNEVVNGAREGARVGAVGASPTQIRTMVKQKVPNVALTDANIGVFYPDSNGNGTADPGESVVVKVTYSYNTITPLASIANAFTLGSFPTSFTMSACADMRLEGAVNQAVGGTGC